MSKRIRLLTQKNKLKTNSRRDYEDDNDVSTARGRLKGALMEALGDESDSSTDCSPSKKERQNSCEQTNEYTSDEDDNPRRKRSPARQSYVLKLFDRSVDLSQFSENSPLYPICRAWIKNQPKANYNEIGKVVSEPVQSEDYIELPGPEGLPVNRIPNLTPEQKASSKDKINLNYREAPPPTREELIEDNIRRWMGVRQAWFEQASKVEARYANTQQVLNNINVNAL